ncbi:hypothetical protein E2C01_043092 [Portunus trituberculatus]|uniref:Uncharacterized protein n=1 Tax=Portunus trituberculatus TaxID=210409 RepID=A0A5B7FYG0_PORTR|nr:hypothetical protein [Portunus trituberculatus]
MRRWRWWRWLVCASGWVALVYVFFLAFVTLVSLTNPTLTRPYIVIEQLTNVEARRLGSNDSSRLCEAMVVVELVVVMVMVVVTLIILMWWRRCGDVETKLPYLPIAVKKSSLLGPHDARAGDRVAAVAVAGRGREC